MTIHLTKNEYAALWFYSQLDLPEGFSIDPDILPHAKKSLERKKLVEPSPYFPYTRANKHGLKRLEEGQY